jgi:acetyl esterase/lipase
VPVAPDVGRVLTLLHQIGMPSMGAGSVEQARAAFHQLTAGTRFTAVEVGSVEDVADGPVPLRVYRPEGDPRAAIAFFHGGGFVIG